MAYLLLSGLITTLLALLPLAFRVAQHLDVSSLGSLSLAQCWQAAVGAPDAKTCAFFFITTVQRVCLTGLLFFMMCVAERTYKQRLLFAKYFSHITSARKAKKSEIPHFRLKKVQNIKMWLSLRSFLRVGIHMLLYKGCWLSRGAHLGSAGSLIALFSAETRAAALGRRHRVHRVPAGAFCFSRHLCSGQSRPEQPSWSLQSFIEM